MELVMFLEDMLHIGDAGEISDQEELEGTNIAESVMKEAIEGIQKKMDRLMELHTMNEQSNIAMLDILGMVNKFREKIANFNVRDPHRVEVAVKASGSQEQAPKGNASNVEFQELDMSM
eukprot:7703151-Heterocapsa_arctica.AAC.1